MKSRQREPTRDDARETIKDQVAEFLKKGGKISRIPRGRSGQAPTPPKGRTSIVLGKSKTTPA